jgi:hypothetical protein
MLKVFLIISFLLQFSASVYAGENYKWLTTIDDDMCLKAAQMGAAKGQKDRVAGIKDNDKWRFVEKMCQGGCSIGMSSDLATCYENGYNVGYHNRY